MFGFPQDKAAQIAVRTVRELGSDMLPLLFENNPYMFEIYSTEESRKALTVFQIYEGSGEWFDLSKKPIERDTFTFGGAQIRVWDLLHLCGDLYFVCNRSIKNMSNGRQLHYKSMVGVL